VKKNVYKVKKIVYNITNKMKKEMKKMKEKNYDIATSNRQGVVMDNEIERSTPGFTGLVLPRESESEYKSYPILSRGRSVDKVDVMTTAPQNLEAINA